jgi:uncharacterized RDD family membrane protein YckC
MLLDFNGSEAAITPLNQYIRYFPVLFIAFFMIAAWMDSPGVRLLGIRVRTLGGSKPGFTAFAIRSAIITVVFVPLLFMYISPILSIGLTFALGVIFLLPWFKGNFGYRRGLQDVFAGTLVIRI